METDTDKDLQRLAARLRQLRKAKGFSNYELFAFQNELNRSQYGRYENGSDMRFSSLMKVIRALGISVSEFFGEGFEE